MLSSKQLLWLAWGKVPELRGGIPVGKYDVTLNSQNWLSPPCLHWSYAIIMWEVLSRQIPFEGNSCLYYLFACVNRFISKFDETLSFCSAALWLNLNGATRLICVCVCVWSEVTNPMQIMFSVLRGIRPDTTLDSLPADIPSRETLISLMTCGWTTKPEERPSFLSKLSQITHLQEFLSSRSLQIPPSQRMTLCWTSLTVVFQDLKSCSSVQKCTLTKQWLSHCFLSHYWKVLCWIVL